LSLPFWGYGEGKKKGGEGEEGIGGQSRRRSLDVKRQGINAEAQKDKVRETGRSVGGVVSVKKPHRRSGKVLAPGGEKEGAKGNGW